MIDVGAVLQGTYRIERLLGRGGMGAVFAASHARLPKQYAIKVLHAEYARNPEALARFQREAEITSRIGHPNIVEVHDFNTRENEPYIVMEVIDGESLAALLARRRHFSVDETLAIVRPIASALTAAHERAVVHRDLKPQNVIVRDGAFDRLKLVDFGISKLVGTNDITRTTALVGTPAYMAPEQARGQHKLIGGRVDQFALAAITYELLVGRCAFAQPEDAPYAILARVLTEMPAVPPQLPSSVVEVLWRGLAKAPEERFDGVAGFVDALASAMRQHPMVSAVSAPAAANSSAVTDTPSNMPSIGTSLPPAIAVHATAPTKRATRLPWLIAVGGLSIAAVATVMAMHAGQSTAAHSAKASSPAGESVAISSSRPAARTDSTAPVVTGATVETPVVAVAVDESASVAPPLAPALKSLALPVVHGDPSQPAPLTLGDTWAATVPRLESAYLRTTLAPGNYYLVVDTERVDHQDRNLMSKVCLLDSDGAVTRDGVIRFNEITAGYRRVAQVQVAASTVVGFRVANAHDDARFWVTLFDDAHRRLVPFYGRQNASALTVGETGRALLDENDDAFFRIQLTPRTYKFVMQLDNAQHRSTNLIGEIDLLDALGNPVKRAVTMNRIDVSYRQASQLELKTAGAYVLRVHNRKYKVAAQIEVLAE